MTDTKIYIGIDPGTHTGVCVYSPIEGIIDIHTLQLHEALQFVFDQNMQCDITVFVEDARLREWVTGGREKLQGVGSVKRDCKIWEDALDDWDIPFELIAPKRNTTKLTPEMFKKITGWTGKTSEHARDACMLVYGKK